MVRALLRLAVATLILPVSGCSGSASSSKDGGGADGGAPPEACTSTPAPSGDWSLIAVPSGGAFTNVGGSGPNDVWIIGPQAVLQWNGQSWTSSTLPTEPASGFTLQGLTVPQANDVWVGAPQPANWNGSQWSTFNPQVSSSVSVLWASSFRDVWGSMGGGASSPGYMGHFDGNSWSEVGPFLALDGIWGSSSNDVWGVGVDTTANIGRPNGIYHWTGVFGGQAAPALVGLTQSQLTPVAMHAIYGTAANDIWAGGESGTLMHWDGSSWTTATSPVTTSIVGLWGSCSNDYWAVGRKGTVMQYDGTSWQSLSGLTSVDLNGVWGSSSRDVWAVGNSATVLHFTP